MAVGMREFSIGDSRVMKIYLRLNVVRLVCSL